MKVFAMVLTVLVFAASAQAGAFSDVPRSHWAYEAIQAAVDAGVLQGFDGKFEGARLLNRYQMAVAVSKLLDAVKTAGPAGKLGSPAAAQKLLGNAEALSVEFADELALLNVKVSTLEDTVKELKAQCAQAPKAGPAAAGFTAFASFGLMHTDDHSADAYVDGDVLANDSTYFELPQVSIGVDREINAGVFFHAQFDYASTVNALDAGEVGINEAFVLVDELFGVVGAKVGGFALPFSMEHTGPFRTCDLTITPSFINSFFEQIRGYGLELTQTREVQDQDLFWKFGVVSATDNIDLSAPITQATHVFSTVPARLNGTSEEADEGFGFYLTVGQKTTAERRFGWNFSYLTNGGDLAEGSVETDLFNLGIEWSYDDLRILAQYLDGTTDDVGASYDLNSFYLLANYAIDDRQSVSLRYDDAEAETVAGTAWDVKSVTFAYNRKVTENSVIQFEYISPDTGFYGTPDVSDDLVQLRYKIHF